MNDMQRPAPDPFAPLTNAERLDGAAPDAEVWEPILPAPDQPAATVKHPAHGASQVSHVYRDRDGAPLMVVYRFTDASGGKQDLPQSYGRRVWIDPKGKRQDRTGWHWKRPAKPWPLYGLDALAARPDAPVIVVEGEKSAVSAARIFPDHVAVTSGGSTSATSADWSPLAGREVTIWPDRDAPGAKYARAVAAQLEAIGAASVAVVAVPESLPEKWDLADPVPPPFTADDLVRLLCEAQPTAAEAIAMPAGFEWRDGGLWVQPAGKPGQEPPAPKFIAARFDVVAETIESRVGNFGKLVAFTDRTGRKREVLIGAKMLHGDPKEVAGTLAAAGLKVNNEGGCQRYLASFLNQVRPARISEYVSRAGWHKAASRKIYVSAWGTAYGADADAPVVIGSTLGADDAFEAAGTLADWQREVARFAIGNDRAAFVIAASLAGPLLRIVGDQSGGFHLYGDSQSGKTSMLSIGASVWGRGDRSGQIRQWRATLNGLEAVAAETSDAVLFLDEMGQADGREVGDVVYAISNEASKARASRAGGSRSRSTWATMLLSSGEITLETKMAEAGKRMMAGLDVRLSSIPADAGAGMGVVQRLHDFPTAQGLIDHLRRAARSHYGTPARAFIERLVAARADDETGLIDRIEQTRKDLVEAHAPAGMDNQAASIAARFGLAAAAGELAIAWGILPWPRGEALRASGECFEAWLDDRGGEGSGEDFRAIRQVRAFIEAHGAARFERPVPASETAAGGDAAPGLKVRDRVGFVRDSFSRGGVEYLILPQAWRSEVCKGIDAKRTAKLLADRGWLVAEPSSGRFDKKERIPGWPSAIRVYVIRDGILGGDDE
ncbi:MAG: DUF927 domain-containing protein [Proteobacteria bacterium]|nr:DUF927 domain-containing protein [Pseudomonadota bacterium]